MVNERFLRCPEKVFGKYVLSHRNKGDFLLDILSYKGVKIEV